MIDDNPSFLDQFLEYQTNFHFIVLVHKFNCSTLVPILLCLCQIQLLKEST